MRPIGSSLDSRKSRRGEFRLGRLTGMLIHGHPLGVHETWVVQDGEITLPNPIGRVVSRQIQEPT
jgi:hypothetical protein